MIKIETPPSETSSDATSDTTVTVTDSLAELIIDKQGGVNFAALSEDYTLPFDDQVKRNEVLFHDFAQTLCGSQLYLEPELEEGSVAELLEQGGRALDIGCGMEGLWVTAMACRYSKAEIIGVDLMPVTLDYGPPNASFHVLDVCNGVLPFPDGYFNLIHIRSASMWIKLEFRLPEIRRVLSPNGIFLLFESRNALHRPPAPSSPFSPPALIEIFKTCDPTFPSWVERFEGLAELIAANLSTQDTKIGDNGGELSEVREKVVEVHVGRRGDCAAKHFAIQKASTLYRLSLLGYLNIQMYQLPLADSPDFVPSPALALRRLTRLKRFRSLAALLTTNEGVDSGLWETVRMVWGRKASASEAGEAVGGARGEGEGEGGKEGEREKETVEQVFERLLERRRAEGGGH